MSRFVRFGVAHVGANVLRAARTSAGFDRGVLTVNTEHFALRADLTNTWGNQQRAKYYTPQDATYHYNDSRDLGSKMTNDTSLLFGLTFWF